MDIEDVSNTISRKLLPMKTTSSRVGVHKTRGVELLDKFS